MLYYPNILMIGGNARHAGKTTLACMIISKYSSRNSIIGLKVTRIKPEERAFHGDHSVDPDDGFRVIEEVSSEGDKDTVQMLRAGAGRVFYIQCSEESMEAAMEQFFRIAGRGNLVVCESRSLRKFLKPGLFILMIRPVNLVMEKDMSGYMSLADAVCDHGEKQEDIVNILNRIRICENSWKLDR